MMLISLFRPAVLSSWRSPCGFLISRRAQPRKKAKEGSLIARNLAGTNRWIAEHDSTSHTEAILYPWKSHQFVISNATMWTKWTNVANRAQIPIWVELQLACVESSLITNRAVDQSNQQREIREVAVTFVDTFTSTFNSRMIHWFD